MAKRKQQELNLSTLPVLTTENVKVGLKIVSFDNPEWGVKWVKQDRNGYVFSGSSGSAMLFEGEFKFWRVLPNDCYDLDDYKLVK